LHPWYIFGCRFTLCYNFKTAPPSDAFWEIQDGRQQPKNGRRAFLGEVWSVAYQNEAAIKSQESEKLIEYRNIYWYFEK
jgi:hypothetical protein